MTKNTSEALLASHVKRIASETMAFAFSVPVDSRDQTVICRLEKACGRSYQPPYNVNPLCRLIGSKTAKSYSSEKRSLLSRTTRVVFISFRSIQF